MDPSSRTDFVLGDLRVVATELQPEEWLQIVQRVLEICKPYLKYLPGFNPIGELLNYEYPHNRDPRKTDESIIEFPEGINQNTLCLDVASLSHNTIGELPPPGYGVRYVEPENLLLTRKGDWLLWEFRFERKSRFKGNRHVILEMVEMCKFSLLEKDSLLLCLKRKPWVGKTVGTAILSSLRLIAQEGVRERKLRLQGVKDIENQLAGILNRIS